MKRTVADAMNQCQRVEAESQFLSWQKVSEACQGFESVSKFVVVEEEPTRSQVGTSGHKWAQGSGNVSMFRKRATVSKARQGTKAQTT